MKISQKPGSIIWQLGLITLLVNISFVMVYSLSAIYLKTVIAMSTATIGLIAGLAEGLAYAAKLGSGILSDRLRQRKSIILWGYGFVVLSRPLLAIWPTAVGATLARFLERFGNGIQATPLEAWVADISQKKDLAQNYALKRALGMAGAFLGGIIGMIVVGEGNFALVFWWAMLPAALAWLILLFILDEPNSLKSQPQLHFSRDMLKTLPKSYWLMILIWGLYSLGRTIEVFFTLHAHQNLEIAVQYVPVIIIIINGAYSLASYPLGYLSNTQNRKIGLLLGMILAIACNWLLIVANTPIMLYASAVLWGVHLAIMQNIFTTMVADYSPENLRGTGFGIFYLVSACAMSMGGWLGGYVIDQLSAYYAFAFASGFIAISFLFVTQQKWITNRNYLAVQP